MASYASSSAGGDTAGSGDRFAAITPAVGDLIVVFCGVRANSNATPTCSDDQGGTYTLIDAGIWGTGSTQSFFVRDSLVSSAVAHTITVATGSNTSGNVVPVAIAGMTKTGATAVLQTAAVVLGSGGGTPAPAFAAACDTSSVILGCLSDNINPPGQTPPTGWTERQDIGQSTPNNGMQVVTRDSGFTGTTVTWGAAEAGVSRAVVIELDTSGSGGSVYSLPIGHVASAEAVHGVTSVADAPAGIGHVATAEAAHGVTLSGGPATYSLPIGHVASVEAPHGVDLAVRPLVRPEYTGTPRFVLDATGGEILLRGANTILTASDAVSKAAVDNGANAMRLVLNWHVLEPVAPTGSGTDFSTYVTSLDATTLSEIDALCAYYASVGAYIDLDFHQASWSPYYGGSGVPSWYYTDARFTAQQNAGAGWNNSTDKSQAINNWWTDATESPMSQQLYINFVTAFIQWAQTKSWYGHVFGYTTFNELNAGNMTGSSSAKISAMHTWLAPVVAAMNALEPYRAMFVMCRGGGQGWGTVTFSEFGDLASQNICAEFHQYYTGLAPGADADVPTPLTPTYVQEGNVSGSSGASDYGGNINVTWPAATTDGSLLLLVVTQRNSGGGANPVAPTVAGWTQVQTKTFGGTFGRQTIFKIENAASRSGSEVIDLTPAGAASHTRYVAAQLFEYADADAFDVAATAATGSDAAPTTGASGALSTSGELALAFYGILDNSNVAPTTPTNGFTIRRNAGVNSGGTGVYNSVAERVTPDASSLSTAVSLSAADQWVAQLLTFTPKTTAAGVGYDSTGDDYYPDSATVHNTTAGSAYVGAEVYQEAFLGVPLAKAAALGIPAFLGEFGVHYDDTGRLDYVADMTVAMDALALSGCVWKLGVPPGDSLAICSDSAGTLNDVGSAWSTWWLATDFTPGTGTYTIHLGVPSPGEGALGVAVPVTASLPIGHPAAADAAYGLDTPAALAAPIGHVATLETPRGLALTAILADLRIAGIPRRLDATCSLLYSPQEVYPDVDTIEDDLGRRFIGIRKNLNINVSTTGGDSDYDAGYVVFFRNSDSQQTVSGVKEAIPWPEVAAGTHDDLINALATDIAANPRYGPLNPMYLSFHHEMTLSNSNQKGYDPAIGNTTQAYIDAFRHFFTVLRDLGLLLYDFDGTYLGGPIVPCYVVYQGMFLAPDPGLGVDDFDPDLGTSPAPAGTSYYGPIGADIYNNVVSGHLKYGTTAATILDGLWAAAAARGKDVIIPEFGCGDDPLDPVVNQEAADWLDSVTAYVKAKTPGTDPQLILLGCTVGSEGVNNYYPASSALKLEAFQRLARDSFFAAGLDHAYGVSAGVAVALPIGYISAVDQTYGITFLTGYLLPIGHVPSVEAAHGATLAATLAQLDIGYAPTVSAGHGVSAPVVASLAIGRPSTTPTLHGLTVGALSQLPIGHVAASDAASGLALGGILGLSLGHVASTAAALGLDLLVLGRPSMFLIVPCYSGSRTVSPFSPHSLVPLAPAHRVDAILLGDAEVQLEPAAYEVEL